MKETPFEMLMGQIWAMKRRSDKYHRESEPGSEEAEKHMRVFCVLQELERLGRAFEEDAAPRPQPPRDPSLPWWADRPELGTGGVLK